MLVDTPTILTVVGMLGGVFLFCVKVISDLADIKLKLKQLWEVHERRVQAMAEKYELGSRNSPFSFNARGMSMIPDAMKAELLTYYETKGCKLSAIDLWSDVIKRFQDQLIENIKIPEDSPLRVHDDSVHDILITCAIDFMKANYLPPKEVSPLP